MADADHSMFRVKGMSAPLDVFDRQQAQAIYDELHQQGIRHTSEDCGPGGLVHRTMYNQALKERDAWRRDQQSVMGQFDTAKKQLDELHAAIVRAEKAEKERDEANDRAASGDGDLVDMLKGEIDTHLEKIKNLESQQVIRNAEYLSAARRATILTLHVQEGHYVLNVLPRGGPPASFHIFPASVQQFEAMQTTLKELAP